jgi:hypothetical protein
MSARKTIAAALAVLCAMVGVSALTGPWALAAEYLPSGTFGSEGSGDGQFKEPAGVAVNEVAIGDLGDVYVIDTGDSRIERFNAEGAYLSQWDGSATAAGSFFFSNGQESAQGIAVDNSREPLDSAAGDVYVADTRNRVVDQFTAEGAFAGLEIKGTCPHAGQCASGEVIPFPSGLSGVAVDSKGNLWVSAGEKLVYEFSDTGAFEKEVPIGIYPRVGLGVDTTGGLYIVNEGRGVSKYPAGSGEQVFEFGLPAYALAVVPNSNDVLVDQGSRVTLYGPFAEPSGSPPLEVSPSEGLFESYGAALNATSENKTVYASERGADQVTILDSVKFPTPTTEQPSQIKETAATLHGTVDTEGKEVTECRFEYELESSFGNEPFYSEQLPCEQTPAEINALSKGGTEPVAVSAELSGLSARKNYHYRLSVSDPTDTRVGSGVALYTFGAPSVEEETVPSVTSTGATVRASLGAGGMQTSYSLEYGMSAGYGSSTQEVDVGSPEYPISVQVSLNGLTAGVEYHFRVVATNSLGVSDGSDSTFVTPGATGSTASILPDGRVEEIVSSTSGSQSVYDPTVGEPNESHEDLTGVFGRERAAAGGDSVAFLGEPSAEGGNGAFGRGQANQLMATRGSTGWTAQDITPEATGAATVYEYFSPDLVDGIIASEIPVGSTPPALRPHCFGLYKGVAGSGNYLALYSEVEARGECGYPQFGGMSADGSHVLFSTPAALTPGSLPGDANHPKANEEDNLYVSVGGDLDQINILPNGETETSPDASFGAPSVEEEWFPDLSNVISADGSRVFWTSSDYTPDFSGRLKHVPRALYVRENASMPQSPIGRGGECADSSDACTVQVDSGEHACVLAGRCGSGGGRFWGASADGSRVFFSDCAKLTANSTAVPGEGCTGPTGNDLYEYDVETGKLTDLTIDPNGDSLGADVQGVLGTSESGGYVYFIADGVLASGATQGSRNLYLWHDGETSFVGVLLNADNNLSPLFGSRAAPRGDWRGSMGERTAEVTSDGHNLVFTSASRLTGYDNHGLREVFVYDAPSGDLVCASCNTSGAPPSVSSSAIGAYLPTTYSFFGSAFMERSISSDGSRVFFDTSQPLVPQDVNGLQDVYEWERGGAGSCPAPASKGCIYLLSGGQSSDNAYLLDSDATGENVFLTSREKLVPQANGKIALYDARVDGGFPEAAAACTGTGCQGVPPAPPIFATPSSATFNGVGNFSPPAKVAAKPPLKRAARCKRGFVKKRGRCVRKTRKAKRSAKLSSARTRKGGRR